MRNKAIKRRQSGRTTAECLRQFFIIGGLVFLTFNDAFAQDKDLVVRIAKLQIDPAQLEKYKALLKEEIETSLRVEPGVLTLNAVHEKNDPTRIMIMEVYADTGSYKAHLETPHFWKYKTSTKDMVKSLDLIETVPIALGTKPRR